MSRAFIADVIQGSTGTTQAVAREAANTLVDSLVAKLIADGKFTLPSFGTFSVRQTKARTALNPRTGEKVHVKAGQTVRFKASKVLKEAV